jgi:CheY-like chemotaxis protein
VPLKVLLADDNITAQRMGSKILTDAGYSVVAVSNGAAAVKKIASEKPELLILDVYMPGYTGLEVCDKVKSAAETARTPVLLTITSMEPYRPEDGVRVKADGVLTKPFEATDLLAVVRKLEEKLHPTSEDVDTTVKMQVVEEFSDQSYADWKADAAPDGAIAKAPEMSQEVGSAPVLGIEGLAPASDSAPAFEVESASAPFVVESQPAEVPTFDLSAPAPAFDLQHAETSDAAPVVAPPPELEFTSAPQAGPAEVMPASEFEPTMQAGADDQVPVGQEPALATDPSDFMQFATKFGQEHPEEIPVGIAMEEPAHEQTVAEIHKFVAESAGAPEAAGLEHEMRQAFEASDSGAAAAPVPEPEQDWEAGIDTQPLEIFPEPQPAPAVEFEAAPAPEHVPGSHTQKLVAQCVAELEAAQREAPAAAATAPAIAMDEQRIAEAADRVLERYKDELIAAILRELRS